MSGRGAAGNGAEAQGKSAIGRALILIGAALLAALVLVATERARPDATQVGTMLGLEPIAPRLSAIADRIAVAHRQPSAADLAFADRAAAAVPLSAYPYYIATAAPGTAPAQQRRLTALALQRDPRLRPALTQRIGDLAKAQDVAGMTRALLRLAVLSPRNTQIWPVIAQVSADPAARAVIKAELDQGAAWRKVYLEALSQSSVDRAAVFEMMQAGKPHGAVSAPPPTGQASEPTGQASDRQAFINGLIARKDYQRAYLAWVQWLPAASQAATGYVFDGAFRGASALPPFAWQLADGIGGATMIDPATGLSLDFAGSDGSIVAQQMLLLSPGRYQLATQANFPTQSNDSDVAPLVWTVSCLSATEPLSTLAVPLAGASKRAVGAPFEVPTDCEAQTLVLKVNSVEFAKRLAGKIRFISVEAVK